MPHCWPILTMPLNSIWSLASPLAIDEPHQIIETSVHDKDAKILNCKLPAKRADISRFENFQILRIIQDQLINTTVRPLSNFFWFFSARIRRANVLFEKNQFRNFPAATEKQAFLSNSRSFYPYAGAIALY